MLSATNESDNFSDLYSEIRDSGEAFEANIIELANQHVTLLSILKKYNLPISDETTGSGWMTPSILCPFPFHQEKTGSFGYLPSEDRFNCFGCKSSGRAVEFIAFFKSKSKIYVAKKILDNLGIHENDAKAIIFDNSNKIISEILFDFSIFVRSYIDKYRTNKDMLKIINNIIYSWDMFIGYIVTNNSGKNKKLINIEKLKIKVETYKEYIESIESIGRK